MEWTYNDRIIRGKTNTPFYSTCYHRYVETVPESDLYVSFPFEKLIKKPFIFLVTLPHSFVTTIVSPTCTAFTILDISTPFV